MVTSDFASVNTAMHGIEVDALKDSWEVVEKIWSTMVLEIKGM